MATVGAMAGGAERVEGRRRDESTEGDGESMCADEGGEGAAVSASPATASPAAGEGGAERGRECKEGAGAGAREAKREWPASTGEHGLHSGTSATDPPKAAEHPTTSHTSAHKADPEPPAETTGEQVRGNDCNDCTLRLRGEGKGGAEGLYSLGLEVGLSGQRQEGGQEEETVQWAVRGEARGRSTKGAEGGEAGDGEGKRAGAVARWKPAPIPLGGGAGKRGGRV